MSKPESQRCDVRIEHVVERAADLLDDDARLPVIAIMRGASPPRTWRQIAAKLRLPLATVYRLARRSRLA